MAAPRRPLIELPPGPPPTPRALGPAVLRRSLLEPRVRFWWLAAGVLLLATLYFLISRSMDWYQELNIVRHGTAVVATINHIGDGEVEGRNNLSPDYKVAMQFVLNGQEHNIEGYLEGRTETISLKQEVPIKVDPADPEHWTYRTDVPPFTHTLLSAGLLAPFVLAAGVVTFMLRRRVLRIWSSGMAAPFAVEKTAQSALAPRSLAVYCRPLEGRDQRLVCVFIPRRRKEPKPGEILWLIHPAAHASAALAAINYEL